MNAVCVNVLPQSEWEVKKNTLDYYHDAKVHELLDQWADAVQYLQFHNAYKTGTIILLDRQH